MSSPHVKSYVPYSCCQKYILPQQQSERVQLTGHIPFYLCSICSCSHVQFRARSCTIQDPTNNHAIHTRSIPAAIRLYAPQAWRPPIPTPPARPPARTHAQTLTHTCAHPHIHKHTQAHIHHIHKHTHTHTTCVRYGRLS